MITVEDSEARGGNDMVFFGFIISVAVELGLTTLAYWLIMSGLGLPFDFLVPLGITLFVLVLQLAFKNGDLG